MDGYQLAIIITSVLLIVSSGYIRLLSKEIKELISAITQAIEDKRLTKAEIKFILAEAIDVKNVFIRILQIFNRQS